MRILTKLILLSTGGFIVSMLIFFFLIRPNLTQVGSLFNTGIEKQTELKTLLEQIIAYKNSESDLNAVSNTDKILNSILPREILQVGIKELESAALLTNTVEGMTIQETLSPTNQTVASTAKPVIAGNPGIEEVPYTINISGAFTSLVVFLQYIEHLPHFTEVTKISFGASTSDTDTEGIAVHAGNLTGTINAIFFIKKAKP